MAEKAKKKQFVKVIAPRQFNEQVIGESLVADPRLLIGRKIRINMMSLTNDPKNQNVQVKFEITALKGQNVSTEVIGYTLLPAFIRRLVRKDKRRVDDAFVLKTNDNKNLKIKIFLLTLNKTTNSVLTALRKAIHESLSQKLSKMSYSALINDLVHHKLQNILRREMAKVYPLKQCEIRSLEIITEKKQEEVKKPKIKVSSKPAEKKEEKPENSEKKVEPEPKKEEENGKTKD